MYSRHRTLLPIPITHFCLERYFPLSTQPCASSPSPSASLSPASPSPPPRPNPKPQARYAMTNTAWVARQGTVTATWDVEDGQDARTLAPCNFVRVPTPRERRTRLETAEMTQRARLRFLLCNGELRRRDEVTCCMADVGYRWRDAEEWSKVVREDVSLRLCYSISKWNTI